MKIVLKFKIIHYYICDIVGLFYIELLYWRDRMRGVGSVYGLILDFAKNGLIHTSSCFDFLTLVCN